ncbi:MAG: hypothetical protein COS35_11615 [Zetaproteobacteria bacterium CG02_land_8_20_14_3_00_50_9]|nr:MAG: hypothetical protein COW62_01025 [Zetaproteobacteria bacterium CG17_big_fil_post_rev_8_21_14_2_50_50_13]PIV29524.1 MAG: hypothetical protein COS35_11615 [Zetaproteobacteria bacterium CG02_land_8_20_14_3_00_50_9]PIY55729.1 MAG: hypothetical protein COZ00_07950 [Zetaproteobacteria bacterium CG_4_10_14_0_8_um_filter_49_80]
MARRSDHTREELTAIVIDIAELIVASDGLAGLSARKVATEAGYTVGTLYLIFKNIDGLITEVNLKTLKQLEGEISQALQGISKPEKAIAMIARTYLNYATTRSKRWRAVFDHQLPADDVFPEHYHQQVAQLFSLIESPLKLLRPDESQAAIIREARAIWASVHGLAMLSVGEKLNPADAEPIEILDLILNRIIGFDPQGGRK